VLKSKFPNRYACDDNFGFTRELRRRLRERWAWGSRRSHSDIGNDESADARPAKKLFLNICIARSAALRRCAWGGTS